MSDTNTPPPIISDVQYGRNYTGWIVLLLLFGFMAVSELTSSGKSSANELEAVRNGLRMVASKDAAKRQMPFAAKTVEEEASTKDQVDKLLAKLPKKHSVLDAITAIQGHYIAGEPIPQEDLDLIKNSKIEGAQVAYEIYSSKKITPQRATELRNQLPVASRNGSLIAMHLRMKSGDPNATEEITPPWKKAGRIVVMLGAGLLFCLSILVWIGVVALKLNGALRPLGTPVQVSNNGIADRYAMRAAQIVGAFFVVQIAAEVALIPVPKSIRAGLGGILVTALMIPAVIWLSKMPIANHTISLRRLGISKEHLGRDILLGIAAFAAEIPLTFMVGALGNYLFSNLKTPEHPAATALIQNPTPLVIIGTMFMACICAPFWEELLFRGLLFPALNKLTNRVFLGAFLSSFIFASIHPQGVAAWMALANVGIVSCVMAHYSKSLVPSIVMHACHNTFLLLMALFIS